jgi:alpha-L-arabinofuranosidase
MLVTVLKDSAAKPDSEAMNSVDAPRRVTAHTHTDTQTVGNHFRLPLDPYSLTVLELSLAP